MLNKELNKYPVIGAMSGSSMDGLDLAYCELEFMNQKWTFRIGPAETIPYDEKWKVRLTQLEHQPAFIYPKTDLFYGKYIGQCINAFIKKNNLKVDLIASHGHTVFHQPENGFTAQIGNGASIHAETGLPVVSDFRTVDVMLGGQGAPLVPMGDKVLFSEYDACLNLGGFANISYRKEGKMKAFDVCPCNIMLNRIAEKQGKEFDEDGKMAASGTIHPELLNQLNALEFYQKQGAKSLGKEWVNHTIWPVVLKHNLPDQNILATFVEHIVVQLSRVIEESNAQTVLVTGGGAFNDFLMEQLQHNVKAKCVIPDTQTIAFKEALIFAFLGVLKIRGEENVLSEVTGSSRNNIGGALWGIS